jgi:hypothetical protein
MSAMDDLTIALRVAAGAHRDAIPKASRFGRLYTFSADEQRQLRSLKDLIVRYVTNPSPPRPLCVAVFGQPGSGKSFAAKELCNETKKHSAVGEKVKLPVTVVNMTQVANAVAIGRVLARVAGEQDSDTVPVLFIDEFDASRDGSPYGWLSWFLAPMHDGEFLHEGATIRLTRAVYIFAGGTADTMEGFSAQSSSEFRSAKGPDFISRLRGYLDVQGPNQAPREIRRAIILRSELDKRLPLDSETDPPEVDREMLTSLLGVGRYRHGARSIAAIVEMSSLPKESQTLSWDVLPENHLLKLHVDRGPLDAERIDGSIALSGYTSGNRSAIDCWLKVADALWNEGATLAYVWVPGDNELMRRLADKLSKRAVEPKRRQVDRRRPAAWLNGYMSEDMTMRGVDKIIAREKRERCGLHVFPQRRLGAAERNQLGHASWMINSLSRFRRRFAMSEASVARFAVGGWTTGHKSRVPGIAEEVMLTLAFGRPVYVAGGFGGAAADLGVLLGLSDIRSGGTPDSFAPNSRDDELENIAEKFQPAPLNDLPVKSTEIVTFLKAHALGGSAWPKNGLSRSENRALFCSTDPEEVANLVVQGLRTWAAGRTLQR